VRVRADEDAPPMDPDAEASLFRVAQEAVTNAIRHGRSHRVDIQLSAEPESGPPTTLRLEVHDDGGGVPAGHDPEALSSGGHFGLAGMGERAALLGGRLDVGASEPSGTAVVLTAPWPFPPDL
ncbi:sensor histidine kinase, partial [Rubrivirga sp.]|uniref:sensor histidine kinase n=1 Tax=Rubrivirga sp. TaxID=1885344 RepID=UPI003C7328F2